MEVLGKYWNDHRMDHAVDYITSSCFDTPFDFFQSFGSYWDEQGWSRIGHQLEDLYKRLIQFFNEKEIRNRNLAEGLMKYDYLLNHRYKPRKVWWDDSSSLSREERSNLYSALNENSVLAGQTFSKLGLTERDLYKHTLIEKFPFLLGDFIDSEKITPQVSYGLVYFDPGNNGKSSFYPLNPKTLSALG